MSDQEWPDVPDVLGQGIAHNARVWNYWLGGKDNYAVDRQVGEHVTRVYPAIGEVARADRQFLSRAVTYLAREAGVRQFLDIGTGLPTADNTHEVAQRVASDVRVVYVDNDPVVLTHARALLADAGNGGTAFVDADARDPSAILRAAAETLDFTRPVGVMMLGILNFVLDTDEAQSVVDHLLDAVPSGSHLVATHPTLELGGEANADAMRFWNENATPPIVARSREEFARFFGRLEMVEPGIVSCAHWRSGAVNGSAPEAVAQFGAVARKG